MTTHDSTTQNVSDPSDPVPEGDLNRRHSWSELRETGVLWWVNRSIHIFGWVIIVATDDETDEVVDVYPARTEWRGFDYDAEERGHRRLTAWMRRAGEALKQEVDRD